MIILLKLNYNLLGYESFYLKINLIKPQNQKNVEN